METLNVNTEAQASKLEKTALEIFETSTIQCARDNFLRDGVLSAMVFIILEKEGKLEIGIMPVHDFLQNTGTKDALSELMKKIGEKMSPVAISMVTECWMSNCSKMSKEEAIERYQNMLPSQDPDRIEVIMCTFESENILKQVIYKIVREPELRLELVDIPDETSYEGRFVNVLRDMKKVRDN